MWMVPVVWSTPARRTSGVLAGTWSKVEGWSAKAAGLYVGTSQPPRAETYQRKLANSPGMLFIPAVS